MFEQLGLIGCGLMGGSFALALKRAGLVRRVVGYSKSPSTTERARELGGIDIEAPSALVAATEATLKAIRHLIDPKMLILDVGSTKRDVVDAARRVLKNDVGLFVPCHPITGREVSGVENADAGLYTGQQVILTPIERTLAAKTDQAEALWRALGCDVVRMSPESHDAAFAAVGFLDRGIEHAFARSPDVRSRAVATDEREDGVVGNVELAVLDGNLAAFGWGDVFVCHNYFLLKKCGAY